MGMAPIIQIKKAGWHELERIFAGMDGGCSLGDLVPGAVGAGSGDIWITSVDDEAAGFVVVERKAETLEVLIEILPQYRSESVAETVIRFCRATAEQNWPEMPLAARFHFEDDNAKQELLDSDFQFERLDGHHFVLTRGGQENWWRRARRIQIVVDNESWIIPYAENLAVEIEAQGDEVAILRSYDEQNMADISFLLGCTHIAPREFLSRSRACLVVHESDLPKGRGFSPLTWTILANDNTVPICLLYASNFADSGPVAYRQQLDFRGHELIDEMREQQGKATVDICLKYLRADTPSLGTAQIGEATHYDRRRSSDSVIDINLPLVAQFNLLRVVDNDRYPAYFQHNGHDYTLRVIKKSANQTLLDMFELDIHKPIAVQLDFDRPQLLTDITMGFTYLEHDYAIEIESNDVSP